MVLRYYWLPFAPLLALAPIAARAATDDPAATVRRYYDQINRGHLHQAFALWNKNADHHQTYATFVAGFADTRRTTVTTGKPRDPEGAAGSYYVDVPVTIVARQKDGSTRRYAGSYTLRSGDTQIPGNEGDGAWTLWSAKITQR